MANDLEHNNLISRWLSGDLTADEKEELSKSEDLNDLKAVLDDIDTWSVSKYDAEIGLSKLKSKRADATKVISWNSYFKVAAVITLLIVAYFFGETFLDNGQVELATDAGETREIVLPDGSIVKLDVLTTLSYIKEDWKNNRVLELKGQAFFEVKKGSTFTVKSELGNVQVLGTKFNFKALNNTFSVECYEGKIRVQNGKQTEILKAQEGVILEHEKLDRTNHIRDLPLWVDGFSEYSNAPLYLVIRDLKKYYSVKIELPKKYRNLRFNGRVANDNLEKALRGVFIPMEINYTLNENGKVVFN